MHPVLLRVTDTIAIKSWGIMLAIAFILGILITARNARKAGLNFSDFIDMGFWVVIAAIVGSRVFFILFNLPKYFQDPIAVLKIWRGGLIFYGGLFGAVVTAIVFMKRRGIPVWLGADLVAPQVALGYAITRVGCFLNGCCWGKPTSLPWGVAFPGVGIRLHPVQLYASAANLGIFAILLIAWRRRRFDGQIFWGYLMLYSIYRFAIEFLRGDNAPLAYGLTVPQLMSIVLFACALAAWLNLRARGLSQGAGPAPETI